MKYCNILISIIITFCFGNMVKAQSTSELTPNRGYIVKVGDTAPDFVTTLDNGKTFKLSDHRGKIVMLQFTASWCGVCRREMPFIENEIWERLEKEDFVIIGVDFDEPIETIKKFSASTNITYPLALDPNGDIFGLYADKKSGVTRNVIIDREGKIVYQTRLFDMDEFNKMKEVIFSFFQ